MIIIASLTEVVEWSGGGCVVIVDRGGGVVVVVTLSTWVVGWWVIIALSESVPLMNSDESGRKWRCVH